MAPDKAGVEQRSQFYPMGDWLGPRVRRGQSPANAQQLASTEQERVLACFPERKRTLCTTGCFSRHQPPWHAMWSQTKLPTASATGSEFALLQHPSNRGSLMPSPESLFNTLWSAANGINFLRPVLAKTAPTFAAPVAVAQNLRIQRQLQLHGAVANPQRRSSTDTRT